MPIVFSFYAEPKIAAMRKTEFVDDFMKNSYTSDISDEYSKKIIAQGFTKSAKAKIEAAGGKAVVPGEEPVAEQ